MATETSPSVFYEKEENLQKLCDFLRTREGPPCREALLMEKRVLYLKGKVIEKVTSRDCDKT